MTFHTFGNRGNQRLLLIPGLGMNHGQLLVDHPEEIANRILLHERESITGKNS